MAGPKIYAGGALRQLRRVSGLTQAAMASALDISPSYLNLIENGQRPLSAALIVRLAERFGFDPARLNDDHGIGGAPALRRRLSDPMFADLGIAPDDVEGWLQHAPMLAAAFARIYDRAQMMGEGAGAGSGAEVETVKLVRLEIERWSNHFADLDAAAEALADELRLSNPDLYGAIAERLRARHQIALRILPADIMPGSLRRLDLHARQLQLSELLSPSSRNFQAAVMLGQLEARDQLEALAAGAKLPDRASLRLFKRHLAHYFAAALMMPYGRILRSAEGSGYDLPLLERRFGVSFEQLAHRLTTLQRVGARGLPFFMLRIDRAGQISKRYAGASGSPMVDGAIGCARWRIFEAFERPHMLVHDHVVLEDGSRWLSWARNIEGQARDAAATPARFAVVLGLEQGLAAPISAPSMQGDYGSVMTARAATGTGAGSDGVPANPVGLGCARCQRADCIQRARPPLGRTLIVDERARSAAAFSFG